MSRWRARGSRIENPVKSSSRGYGAKGWPRSIEKERERERVTFNELDNGAGYIVPLFPDSLSSLMFTPPFSPPLIDFT